MRCCCMFHRLHSVAAPCGPMQQMRTVLQHVGSNDLGFRRYFQVQQVLRTMCGAGEGTELPDLLPDEGFLELVKALCTSQCGRYGLPSSNKIDRPCPTKWPGLPRIVKKGA